MFQGLSKKRITPDKSGAVLSGAAVSSVLAAVRSPRLRVFLISAGISFILLPTRAYAAFDTASIDWAIQELCGHINGHLGGLLVTVAAFGALIAAAFGTYRVFHGAIITAVGAFAIVNIMSLYFDQAAGECRKGTTAAASGTGAAAAAVAGGVGAAAAGVAGTQRSAVEARSINPDLNLKTNSTSDTGTNSAEDDSDAVSKIVD